MILYSSPASSPFELRRAFSSLVSFSTDLLAGVKPRRLDSIKIFP